MPAQSHQIHTRGGFGGAPPRAQNVNSWYSAHIKSIKEVRNVRTWGTRKKSASHNWVGSYAMLVHTEVLELLSRLTVQMWDCARRAHRSMIPTPRVFSHARDASQYEFLGFFDGQTAQHSEWCSKVQHQLSGFDCAHVVAQLRHQHWQHQPLLCPTVVHTLPRAPFTKKS